MELSCDPRPDGICILIKPRDRVTLSDSGSLVFTACDISVVGTTCSL